MYEVGGRGSSIVCMRWGRGEQYCVYEVGVGGSSIVCMRWGVGGAVLCV